MATPRSPMGPDAHVKMPHRRRLEGHTDRTVGTKATRSLHDPDDAAELCLRTGASGRGKSANRQRRMPLQQLPRRRCQIAVASRGSIFSGGQTAGTRFVLYRKDRVPLHKRRRAAQRVPSQARVEDAPVVATCCNTPVFLDFQNGHWLSLYACLWPQDRLPPLDLRTMTSDLPDGSVLPDDVPNGKRQTIWFFAKFLGAMDRDGIQNSEDHRRQRRDAASDTDGVISATCQRRRRQFR